MKKIVKRVLWTVIIFVAALYAGGAVWLRWNENRLVFHPNMRAPRNDLQVVHERIELRTSDGVKLVGWVVPSKDSSEMWIIFFHGNAGDVSDRAPRYDQFGRFHLNTLAVDYPGFGESEGEPGEQGFYRTADACYAYLTEARKIPANHVLIYGHSLGSGPAIDLASRVDAAALIVEGAITSVPDRGQELYPYFPIRLISGIRFASIDKIDRVKYPKLIIHAADDETNPIAHGRKLFDRALEPKTFLEIHGGHNYANVKDRENFERGFGAFLTTLRTEPTKNSK